MSVQEYTKLLGQWVLVDMEIAGVYHWAVSATVILDQDDDRHGTAVIEGRKARVFQKFITGEVQNYDWVHSYWLS